MPTYTGTCIKDLSTSTPIEGSTAPSELNDSDREIKTVLKNQFAVTTCTSNLTLTASHHLVLCDCSSTAISITLPTASSVASSSYTKQYTIMKTDNSTNAVTIVGTVNGTSNPTLTSQYEAMTVETNGTSWYMSAAVKSWMLDTTVSSFAKTILDDTSASDVMTTLGITSAAQAILDDTTSEAILTTLGARTLTAAPSTDTTWSGPSATLTAAENLSFGEVCYVNSSGKMAKGDADALSTSGVIAMAGASISMDNDGTFILPGAFVRNDAWNWTPGGLIYLSTTAGALTQTAPSGTDDVIQIVGVATHADRMIFYPQLLMYTHT